MAQVQQKIQTDIQGFRLTLDGYGVRHAFGGHSQEWGSRDHYLLTEADVSALPEWVFAPTAMLAEAARSSSLQPQRMRLEHIDGQQVKTVVILEIRPKYRRLF
ncbi:MAG: hypothetical protein EOO36_13530 [Cytophagaceae bacterium]|nr:MAG: hypothetical protein EOO36_13530 [Cytophagaceae bacterium]